MTLEAFYENFRRTSKTRINQFTIQGRSNAAYSAASEVMSFPGTAHWKRHETNQTVLCSLFRTHQTLRNKCKKFPYFDRTKSFCNPWWFLLSWKVRIYPEKPTSTAWPTRVGMKNGAESLTVPQILQHCWINRLKPENQESWSIPKRLGPLKSSRTLQILWELSKNWNICLNFFPWEVAVEGMKVWGTSDCLVDLFSFWSVAAVSKRFTVWPVVYVKGSFSEPQEKTLWIRLLSFYKWKELKQL